MVLESGWWQSPVKSCDLAAREAAAARQQQLTKPAGSLGELETIAIRLAGGTLVHAVITNEAALELGLKPGAPACALIKASHVVIGVPA